MRFDVKRPRNDDERILPLINVVFLLLIFFMVAGRLSSSDPFEISPPNSRGQAPPAAQEMMLLVGRNGELAVDGEVMSSERMRQIVAARFAEDTVTKLRLKADAGADAVLIVGIMEILRDAGVEKLQLLTVPGENR